MRFIVLLSLLLTTSCAGVSKDRQPANSVKDRYDVVRAVVVEHVEAENVQDMEREMNTYAENAVFEDVALNIKLQGKVAIQKNYEEREKQFPDMKFYVERLILDDRGAFAELRAVFSKSFGQTHPERQIPVVAYFDVDDNGKISREKIFKSVNKPAPSKAQ